VFTIAGDSRGRRVPTLSTLGYAPKLDIVGRIGSWVLGNIVEELFDMLRLGKTVETSRL
jgi:hypothetical protein